MILTPNTTATWLGAMPVSRVFLNQRSIRSGKMRGPWSHRSDPDSREKVFKELLNNSPGAFDHPNLPLNGCLKEQRKANLNQPELILCCRTIIKPLLFLLIFTNADIAGTFTAHSQVFRVIPRPNRTQPYLSCDGPLNQPTPLAQWKVINQIAERKHESNVCCSFDKSVDRQESLPKLYCPLIRIQLDFS